MLTVLVLVHVFALTGPRFGIVTHERSLTCEELINPLSLCSFLYRAIIPSGFSLESPVKKGSKTNALEPLRKLST